MYPAPPVMNTRMCSSRESACPLLMPVLCRCLSFIDACPLSMCPLSMPVLCRRLSFVDACPLFGGARGEALTQLGLPALLCALDSGLSNIGWRRAKSIIGESILGREGFSLVAAMGVVADRGSQLPRFRTRGGGVRSIGITRLVGMTPTGRTVGPGLGLHHAHNRHPHRTKTRLRSARTPSRVE
jgi:hypothetical protein